MNYQDLAEAIFPNAKPVEYYEKLYPVRDLPEGAIVTRVAPSPTGSTHIGTLYQAMVARLLAKQSKGVFFVRIEDTDTKRKVDEAVELIYDTLKYYDMMPDEYQEKDKIVGNYGPYVQSERKDIYQAYAKYMIELGKAYPCFETPEEGEERIKRHRYRGFRVSSVEVNVICHPPKKRKKQS